VCDTRKGLGKNIGDVFLPRDQQHDNLALLEALMDIMPAYVEVLR
jgi:hypothetical protein